MATHARIACFATQGSGHGDEARIQSLLEDVDPELLPFARARRTRSAVRLLRTLLSKRPDLVVMEGTGIAGGAAVLLARLLGGVRYVVSSGDAVGPFVGVEHTLLGRVAAQYERVLCRHCAGFIGWTPYLVGRALTFKAPRAMTAAGWAEASKPEDREQRRLELGIPPDAIVFGLIGSLDWSSSVGYCYGLELVEAVTRTERSDVRVVVIGDGSGLDRLKEVAATDLGGRVLLPGRVPRDSAMSYLSAFDVGSLPQSVDRVGSFRYTIKLSEYLAARLPIVTGQIPLAYDLDGGWLWRLAGRAPWDPAYVDELSKLMRTVTRGDIQARQSRLPADVPEFDRDRQRRRVSQFLSDLLLAHYSSSPD